WNKWNDTSREVHEMFKTTAIDTLKQDKKCQACWYIILSTMSGSTTINQSTGKIISLKTGRNSEL
ncbi:MAG TPA: hypothetical protein VEL11_17370, partial [Candidatus Bathyarchaeia archaeon]|nr:hypothetical protein [Candidatus Bathyarchaeia archaeon]